MSEEGTARGRIEGRLGLSEAGEAVGYALDPMNPTRRLVVEILADGYPVALLRADHYLVDGPVVGDGCHGFAGKLPEAVLSDAETLEARLANTAEAVGQPLRLPLRRREPAEGGEVRWSSGLRLSGRLGSRQEHGGRVVAVVDGEVVCETTARRWTTRDAGAGYTLVPRFDLDLPAWLADGRVRHVEVLGPDGMPLRGSPCALVTFPDGLAGFVEGRAELESEKVRVRFADRLLPQSLPLEDFAAYRDRFFGAATAPLSAGRSARIVLLGEEGLEASLGSLAAQADVRCDAAAMPAAASAVEFEPEDLAEALASLDPGTSAVVFARAGTSFRQTALPLLCDALACRPDTVLAYGDVALAAPDGSLTPAALPAFDYERSLEQGYGARLFAVPPKVAADAARRGATSLFGLFLDAVGQAALEATRIVHVPQVLADIPSPPAAGLGEALARAVSAHLEAVGQPSEIRLRHGVAAPTVQVARRPAGDVSVIVSARENPQGLAATLGALRATQRGGWPEIVVADAGSPGPDAVASAGRLAAQGIKVVRETGHRNPSRLRNAGALAASGSFLLFLDAGLVPEAAGFVGELLSRAAGPAVGAVAPHVLLPTGQFREAGFFLGPGFAAAPRFDDRMAGEAAHDGMLAVAHEVSAASASALLTPRDLFLSAGGFDADHFPTTFGGLDYCLRLRARDRRVVVTPDARALVEPAAEPGRLGYRGEESLLQRETATLRARWGELLMADPYYSPWMALNGAAYSALAWPPRDLGPRTGRVVPPRLLSRSR